MYADSNEFGYYSQQNWSIVHYKYCSSRIIDLVFPSFFFVCFASCVVQSYVNDVMYAEAYNITHTVRSSNYAYMEADRLGGRKVGGRGEIGRNRSYYQALSCRGNDAVPMLYARL